MKWKPFAFALFLLVCISLIQSSGATSKIDSLKNALDGAPESQKVEILNNLAWELKYIDVQQAFYHARTAYDMAGKTADAEGLAFAGRNLGALNFLTGDYPKALDYLEISSGIAAKNGFDFHLAKSKNIIGLIYREQLKYDDALIIYTQVLEIYEKLGIKEEVNGTLHNIAFIYSEINETAEALDIYHEVLAGEKQSGNLNGIARTANNLGYLYVDIDSLRLAIHYFSMALDHSRKLPNPNFEASALHGMALAHSGLNHDELAIESIQRALEINTRLSNYFWMGNNLAVLAGLQSNNRNHEGAQMLIDSAISIYETIGLKQEKFDALEIKFNDYFVQDKMASAEALCMTALEIYSEEENLAEFTWVYGGLYEIYKRREAYAKALIWHEKYMEARQERSAQRKEEMIFETEIRLKVNQVQRENQHLKAENKLKKKVIFNQRIMFVISLLLMALFVAIILIISRSRRRIKKANRELEARNQEVELKSKQLAEVNVTKDRFMSIIAHDLRSPFNALIGFSDLLVEESFKNDNETIHELAGLINQVSTDTYFLLENLLEWSRSQRGVIEVRPEPIKLSELSSHVFRSMESNVNRKMLQVKNRVDADLIVNADRQMVAVILRNLISNAIKFTGQNGSIILESQTNKNHVEVCIADSGVGIDNQVQKNLFRIEKAISSNGTDNEKGSGLGLILCREFVMKQGGRIWVESKPGDGSRFYFTLPLAE